MIDSILRHYFIPPILLSTFQDESGETRSTCIDGKQRLSSIHNFMSNIIPVREP